MIHVERSRHIKASAQAIFTALSDPQQLAGLLPRVRKVEFLERGDDHARIATHMAFGPFGTLRNEGEVRWQTDRQVTFTTRSPVPVEARWQLVPDGDTTQVVATLDLDLAPMLGPLAAFVPDEQVVNMVGPDLEAALEAIARQVETS